MTTKESNETSDVDIKKVNGESEEPVIGTGELVIEKTTAVSKDTDVDSDNKSDSKEEETCDKTTREVEVKEIKGDANIEEKAVETAEDDIKKDLETETEGNGNGNISLHKPEGNGDVETKADICDIAGIKGKESHLPDLESDSLDPYARSEAPRRVLVKHIDRKKTPDEVEDYFFDNYPESGLENVYSCMASNGPSNKNKKFFIRNVILTFESAENAETFLGIKLKNESLITYRRKLMRYSLEEVIRRREERASAGGGGAGESVQDMPAPERWKQTGWCVACLNFPTTYESMPEVTRYLRECHENVKEVRRQGVKTLVTFKDQKSAERFQGLTYVKYRGCYIQRSCHTEDPRNSGKEYERSAEKRKRDSRTATPQRAQFASPAKEGVQFKLKGKFGPGVDYRAVKSVLENEHGLDVRFVTMVGGEARVRLLPGSDTVAQVVYRLARDQVSVKGQVLIPSELTKLEQHSGSGPKGMNKKPKREKVNDWSDY